MGAYAPRWEVPALAAVASIGIALRFARLDLGWFGVDQARDIATALDIVNGTSWPLIGPTMRRVTRLGALYHYFWALPYALWRDPMAGYWFAAVLSTVAFALAWWVARRLFDPVGALVTAAVAAAHPVWVIDGRICWAPAALPCVVMLSTCVMLGRRARDGAVAPLGPVRAALLGALLGLGVQLHLTMVGWAAAALLLALVDRPSARTLRWGLGIAAVVAAPAVWAMLAASGATDSGLTALPSRGPLAPVLPRLLAAALLPARIFAAFGRWNDADAVPGSAAVAAAVVVAAAASIGVARLLRAVLRGDRGARVLLLPSAVTLALVLGLPGDAWYYYLDAVLPFWALTAGACVSGRGALPRTRPLRILATASILVATVILAVASGAWIRRVAIAGYVPVDPAALTLDTRPGRDVPHAGRVTTVAVKRRAAAVAATLGGDVETVWNRMHGPAFADATGDNAFWVRWSLAQARAPGGELAYPEPDSTARAGPRHLAFWYRDDAIAVGLAAAPANAEISTTMIGPLLAVRYTPRLDYASCRAGDGTPVAVPIRVIPDPRRYGDGTPTLPPVLPATVDCDARADCDVAGGCADERLVVAALGGAGTVALAAGERGTPAASVAALCTALDPHRGRVRAAIERPDGAAAELDLYDVPLGAGCHAPRREER